jgi:hypothetical protein
MKIAEKIEESEFFHNVQFLLTKLKHFVETMKSEAKLQKQVALDDHESRAVTLLQERVYHPEQELIDFDLVLFLAVF